MFTFKQFHIKTFPQVDVEFQADVSDVQSDTWYHTNYP